MSFACIVPAQTTYRLKTLCCSGLNNHPTLSMRSVLDLILMSTVMDDAQLSTMHVFEAVLGFSARYVSALFADICVISIVIAEGAPLVE